MGNGKISESTVEVVGVRKCASLCCGSLTWHICQSLDCLRLLQSGRFRGDLKFRLSCIQLKIKIRFERHQKRSNSRGRGYRLHYGAFSHLVLWSLNYRKSETPLDCVRMLPMNQGHACEPGQTNPKFQFPLNLKKIARHKSIFYFLKILKFTPTILKWCLSSCLSKNEMMLKKIYID